MIEKYQIIFSNGKELNQAGSKAPNDVAIIADTFDFKRIVISTKYKYGVKGVFKLFCVLKSLIDWLCLYFKIKNNSILLIQCPMVGGGKLRNFILKRLKSQKGVAIIALVHDVELLRYTNTLKASTDEFKLMLKVSDKIIVHNPKMLKWFEDYGVTNDKLISLNIFDYLYTPREKSHEFAKSVQIAGNLDLNKSAYLKELKKLNTMFILYGPNYDSVVDGDNITYKGSFPPEQLPYLLDKGFGLIWDGLKSDTCTGDLGNYLRYNNPHKLSLYLSSGLPVFIWAEAAEADFVKENAVGYAINSINDIDSILNKMTKDEYDVLLENVKKVTKKLTSGFYTKTALKQALFSLKVVK